MITIHAQNHKHISQDYYDKTIHSLDLAHISCPCGHFGCLIRYGSYKRKVQLEDRTVSLTITRVYCTACGHTHALLLSSIVPYSQIPSHVQLAAVNAYEAGSLMESVLSGQCVIDENNLKSIIHSYKLHWRERICSARLSLAEWSALVVGCFSHFSRPFMQIKKTTNKLFVLPT